jgi:hypothetical protein
VSDPLIKLLCGECYSSLKLMKVTDVCKEFKVTEDDLANV